MALYWNRGSAVKFKRTDWGFLAQSSFDWTNKFVNKFHLFQKIAQCAMNKFYE